MNLQWTQECLNEFYKGSLLKQTNTLQKMHQNEWLFLPEAWLPQFTYIWVSDDPQWDCHINIEILFRLHSIAHGLVSYRFWITCVLQLMTTSYHMAVRARHSHCRGRDLQSRNLKASLLHGIKLLFGFPDNYSILFTNQYVFKCTSTNHLLVVSDKKLPWEDKSPTSLSTWLSPKGIYFFLMNCWGQSFTLGHKFHSW